VKGFCLILFLVVGFGLSSRAQTVVSFKDWKSEKIQQIQGRISAEKLQLEALKLKKAPETIVAGKPAAKGDSGISHLIQRYEQQLTQEEWNLEVAQDLSITEYVMLYVGAQPSKQRLIQAASKLSAEEVAELMEAYSVSLGVQTPAENILNPPPALSRAVPNKAALGAASATASNLQK
jgi:hypothetical protein